MNYLKQWHNFCLVFCGDLYRFLDRKTVFFWGYRNKTEFFGIKLNLKSFVTY
ncbi:hypothetical protein KKH3_13030 [Pectobacterium actinidiae]|nr:hypothetical protein KKH3_13030 [Pectobacterium actinidiae]